MGFPKQQQEVPGVQSAMDPVPDCGENSYRGSGRLTGKRAVITGGDSGIGRAVAIAYAREGADVLIAYLNEDEDAAEVARLVEDAGRKCVLVRGDLAEPAHCRAVIDRAAEEFGGIDVVVSNAAFQMSHDSLEEISDEEWDYTFRLNVGAYFHLVKAALPHMGPGASVIGSSFGELRYAVPDTGAVCRDQGGDRQLFRQLGATVGRERYSGEQRRARTDLDAADSCHDAGGEGRQLRRRHTLGRAGQPAELASVYVLLASDEGSYISGARVAVTGGRPIL